VNLTSPLENNIIHANMQQLINILKSNADLSSCLSNCSNQGVCKLANQTYICECNENFIGVSCQTDARPCSQLNNCLNNGTCINSLDLTSSSCECPQNGLFYGRYCENRRNLCKNITCSSQGYCMQSQNLSALTQCKCLNGYNGDNCEIESNTIKIVKNVQWSATAICIAVIITFWTLVIGSDVLDYFKIGNYHIDMNQWRFEKFHGLNRGKRIQNRSFERKSHNRFVYKASGGDHSYE
jgi:hypothetical protein